MKIILARHGQTTGDIEGRYGGDYNDHLTPEGKKQSQNLAVIIESAGVDKIFTSPLIRAVETTQIISKTVGVTAEIINDLRERNNYGVLTGLVKKDAKKKFPEEVEELEENTPYHHVKGSEEYYKFAERTIKAFNEIIENEYVNETESIAIITHGGPIRIFFREILGFEFKEVTDCASVEFEYDGEGYEIVEVNGIDGIEAGLA